MSVDIFLQRFEGGAAADADEAVVVDVLGPRIQERGEGWARLGTSDGGADVFGIDDPGSGLMVNHASGREIWDVLFKVACAAGLAAMPVGRGTFVFSEDALSDLRDGVPQPITILTSGDGLRRAVESGERAIGSVKLHTAGGTWPRPHAFEARRRMHGSLGSGRAWWLAKHRPGAGGSHRRRSADLCQSLRDLSD